MRTCRPTPSATAPASAGGFPTVGYRALGDQACSIEVGGTPVNSPPPYQSERRVMSRGRWMALCFSLSGRRASSFGPFPGYAQLVGDSADAVTFFIGSILFTAGGGLQSWLASIRRHSPGGGGSAWWAAIIQSAGTLFFNVTTYQAMHTALTSPDYNRLVWRPDWRGSICFFVSARSRTAPRRVTDGSRCAAARVGGSRQSTCSAASSSESRLSPATSFRRPGRCSPRRRPTGTHRWGRRASSPVRWTPSAPDRYSKMPLGRRLRELEHKLEADVR